MCGIVGAAAKREVSEILLEGLKRLEYRGYDSAGIALFHGESIYRKRALGKVNELVERVRTDTSLTGETGIAHTRWATHGEPSEKNAHPHMSCDEIAIVHNGIIENHTALRAQLQAKGYVCDSETDSELIAHLIHYHQKKDNLPLLEAVRSAVSELEGAYSLGVMSECTANQLIAIRHGSPLLIGLGFGENFFASDLLALAPVTQRYIEMEEGDIAEVSYEAVQVYDKTGLAVEREVRELVSYQKEATEKGQYRHFMQKEIFEQPAVLLETLQDRLLVDSVQGQTFAIDASKKSVTDLLAQTKSVHIVACGTSFHAGMVARYWIESMAGVPCSVEIASEYRYRNPVVPEGTLFVAISQSGETADTLAAMQQARQLGYAGILTVTNIEESAMVRMSDCVMLTRAGREIGVASTKAFTAQLSVLMMLTALLGRCSGHLSKQKEAELSAQLHVLPQRIEEVLSLDNAIQQLASCFAEKHHTLFLGRGVLYPVALEGALKLKEISYIHAEAYAAGELKHGPLALVDSDMPVVVVAPSDDLLEKLKSNLHEVRARGGELIVFTDRTSGVEDSEGTTVIHMPACEPLIAPIVYTVPLQLLAYHVGVIKGTDVDQPRNLAKSVTVE